MEFFNGPKSGVVRKLIRKGYKLHVWIYSIAAAILININILYFHMNQFILSIGGLVTISIFRLTRALSSFSFIWLQHCHCFIRITVFVPIKHGIIINWHHISKLSTSVDIHTFKKYSACSYTHDYDKAYDWHGGELTTLIDRKIYKNSLGKGVKNLSVKINKKHLSIYL